jgi:hypothetical protein
MAMRKALWTLLGALLGMGALVGVALAAQETYELRDGGIYRVDAAGKATLVKDMEPGRFGTDKGVYAWIIVDGELSEAMVGSEKGFYFFDEGEKPLGFLPFDGAGFCDISFSSDAAQMIVNFGADVSQEVTLYDFVGFKKKATFRAIGSATWIDHARFVFTKEDRSKGPRGASAPHQEGWVSVVVYDTAIEEEVPVMEATATKDYQLDGIDYEEGTMTIIERSVKDVKDWNDEQKVRDNVITAPFPAAG